MNGEWEWSSRAAADSWMFVTNFQMLAVHHGNARLRDLFERSKDELVREHLAKVRAQILGGRSFQASKGAAWCSLEFQKRRLAIAFAAWPHCHQACWNDIENEHIGFSFSSCLLFVETGARCKKRQNVLSLHSSSNFETTMCSGRLQALRTTSFKTCPMA